MNTNISQSWRPRHAWFFAGFAFLLTALAVGVLFALAYLFPPLLDFSRLPLAQAGLSTFGFFIIFGASLIFAKVKSLDEFIPAFGLIRPLEREILIAIAVGLVIQFGGIATHRGGLSHLQLARSFQPSTLAVLLAPFFEEPAMRGFAYKAFRNAYPVAVSVCFVVAIGLVFHCRQVFLSLHSCLVIATFNTALCMLREKHSSLWSCIACHFAFNLVYVGIER